jgi:hypothetical protein
MPIVHELLHCRPTVQQATKVQLVLNLNTAIDVPLSLLGRPDEVINVLVVPRVHFED